MTTLAEKKCTPCQGGVEPLRGGALETRAKKLGPGWKVVGEKRLEKEFSFRDFREALDFVDEVGELAVGLQPKLLRALEQQEIQRVGGVKPIKVDVRIVAATNRDLPTLVHQGLFREDLYYRLSVVEVFVPPLRDRPEDVPPLVEQFLNDEERSGLQLAEDALHSLQSHSWPGNVRELRNVIERAARLAECEVIDAGDLHLGRQPGDRLSLAVGGDLPYKEAKARLLGQFERQYLAQLMKEHGGNLSAASREAGLARNHLRNLCRKYNISCGADS